MESKPLRIAIIGGGIGGLAFAISLAKLVPNHSLRLNVDIYESTSSLKAQVGVGLGLFPQTWGVIEFLGIDRELELVTGRDMPPHDKSTPFFQVRKSDQAEGQDLFTLETGGGSFYYLARADLQAVLLNNVPPSFKIHTKKRLRSYTQQSDETLLEFEDGTTATCDLVVGADGLQSRVRRVLLDELASQQIPSEKNSGTLTRCPSQLADPLWTGVIVYRELIPKKKLVDAQWAHHQVLQRPILDAGKNGTVLAYSVLNGEAVAFSAYLMWFNHENSIYNDEIALELLGRNSSDVMEQKDAEELKDSEATSQETDPWADNGGGGRVGNGRGRWVCKVDPAEVKAAYEGWEPEVQVLLDSLESPLRWAIHTVQELPTFVHGRVCVLGDAAHAMLPCTGAGSGQAISDAFVLAHLVASAVSNSTLDMRTQLIPMLTAYDMVRRPIVREVVSNSRKNAFSWALSKPGDNPRELGVEIDLSGKDGVNILQEDMSYHYAMSWDKAEPFREAEKAVDLFRRMLPVHSLLMYSSGRPARTVC